jgi:hypothetical protein
LKKQDEETKKGLMSTRIDMTGGKPLGFSLFSWLFLQNVFGRRAEKKILGKCGMKDLGM